METTRIQELARQLLSGELGTDQFLACIAAGQSLRIPDATIDLDRQRRCGFPEVIFGEGKSVESLCAIMTAQIEHGIDPLATRVSPEQAEAILRIVPGVHYNKMGRTLRVDSHQDDQHSPNLPEKNRSTGCRVEQDLPGSMGAVAVITAGTSDLPVAEEVCETLRWLGIEPVRIPDVGVAGPHRLIERLHELRTAAAIIVIAGMEGALPSIVGGHVACPVIGVPTSVGYGASFGGLSALLGMLNSCASNVVVVNINAGFKAAYVAGMIAKQRTGCQDETTH
ncbi:MAG: nickel pincer cofactor biosynthesis protein LarB [Pirellulales bacterium]|nr:nickel pincer cofactor biosynthesis protein LarB [Pirellulales bacterium]